MALQLVSFKKTYSPPLLNEASHSVVFDDRWQAVAENLFKMIRQSPELLSILDTVVTDHFLGPVDFYDSMGKPLGPTKYKQVMMMWENNNVQGEVFYGSGIDYFADGNGFGWHVNGKQLMGSMQNDQIQKIKEALPNISQFLDEQSKFPIKLSYVPASTVSIHHDEHETVFYRQQVANQTYTYYPDQIVHTRLMDFNGESRGMSPLKALTKEIMMMFMLKENIIAKLQNGGSMDAIISLKGANGTSKARFERLRTALESFSHLKKSHGNMPIDAEVEVHQMGTMLKDMEYRELAMFIISEYALALGIPTSRLQGILMSGSGGSPNKGELSGNSEDSYQSKINARRTSVENSWNRVFRPAGFTFKFRRDNLQDSVRETQASTQRASYVIQVQQSLKNAGKQLTLPAQLAMLSGAKMNLTEEDVEDINLEAIDPFGLQQQQAEQGALAGPGGKMQPGNKTSASKVTQDRSAAKEKTASNNERQA